MSPTGAPPLLFEIPARAEIVRCRACGAKITFILTEKGKRMPVTIEGPSAGQSHFATCSDPKRFRKRDRIKGP